MVHSQSKGYRGEVALIQLLSALGLSAQRVKAKQGGLGGGAADVTSDPADDLGIPGICWEVKNKATMPPKGVRKAPDQARQASEDGQRCALAMKIPRGGWGFYIETKDWE